MPGIGGSADLSDQTVIEDVAHRPVASIERYKRHGHYPGLILVEDNPAFAARLERALFDDHFEVVRVIAEDVPLDALESSFAVYQAAGLVVIYSSEALAPEEKRKLATLAAGRFFDLSVLQLPVEEPAAVRKVLSLIQPLRGVADNKNLDKIN